MGIYLSIGDSCTVVKNKEELIRLILNDVKVVQLEKEELGSVEPCSSDKLVVDVKSDNETIIIQKQNKELEEQLINFRKYCYFVSLKDNPVSKWKYI